MEQQEISIFKYFAVMLVCFAIDSTISYFLPANFSKEGVFVIPAISLMMYLLLLDSIDNTSYRYFFGAICGLYYSIVYSNSLAIYILIYVLMAFIRTHVFKIENLNFFEWLIFALVVIVFQEVVVYSLMKATGVTAYGINRFVINRIFPTLAFNLVMFIPLFYLSKFIIESFRAKISKP